jgi:hypothetical protein
MNCPHCNKPIPDKTIAKHLARKGGKMKGPTKARTSERASKAANARWAKWRLTKSACNSTGAKD